MTLSMLSILTVVFVHVLTVVFVHVNCGICPC